MLFALSLGCGDKPADPDDADGDGFPEADDCDDTDASVYPGADDAWYDGVDSDCGGEDDLDADGDGFGWTGAGGTDCDDTDASVHPDAADPDVDGMDQDCDTVDGPDADGDGFAAAAAGGDDCDDADPSVFPGAPDGFGDGVDQDCDGIDGVDADGDGFASIDGGGDDCDDGASAHHPGAEEIFYDGVDQDCIPDNDADADGDGFDAKRAGGDDCDDGDAERNPGAVDDCVNGLDLDCVDGLRDCGPEAVVDVEDTELEWLARLRGPAGGERVGASLADAGDVTGDGVADLLIGAGGTGRAFLVEGPLTFNNSNELDLGDGIVGGVFELSSTSAHGNAAPAAAGDLDGDGTDDLVLASSGGTGAALVFGPVTGPLDLDTAAVRLFGVDGAGAGVAVGNFSGDDHVDLIVGAPGHEPDERDEDAGALFLLTGPVSVGGDLLASAEPFYGEEKDQSVGANLVTVGDLDGDGFDDLLVGAPAARARADELEVGVVYVVFGAEDGLALRAGRRDISCCDVSIKGTSPGERVGSSLAAPGDVNGDGFDDILVGTDVDGVGRAYLVAEHCGSGSASCRWEGGDDLDLNRVGVRLDGGGDGDEAGIAVAGVGDYDADLRPDVLVGAPGANGGAGAAYVLSGEDLTSGAVDVTASGRSLLGAGSGDGFGRTAATIGDVDGDGVGDVLIGAPGESTAGGGAGTVYLLSPGRIAD